MADKVSIVIPVYNSEKYLRQCLDSVVGQRFKELQIICVDDGSTDDSADILLSYAQRDSRVQVYTQTNTGAGAARNLGLSKAVGKYVCFWDADDLFHPDAIERMYDKAEQTMSEIVLCGFEEYDEAYGLFRSIASERAMAMLPNKDVVSTTEIARFVFQLNGGRAWDKFYQRQFLLKHALAFQNSRILNDQAFTFLAYAYAERIAWIPDLLMVHRMGVPSSISSSHNQYAMESLRTVLYYEEDMLRQTGKYELLERTFINNVASNVIRLCTTSISDFRVHKQIFYQAKNEILPSFHLLERGSEFYDNPIFPEKLRMIAQLEHHEFLMYVLGSLNEGLQWGHYQTSELVRDKFWYFPEETLPNGARMVVYGYGDVGKDYVRQFRNSGRISLVGVVDQNAVKLRDASVKPVSALLEMRFDYVVIAIVNERIATQVRDALHSMGIAAQQILWTDPENQKRKHQMLSE